MLFMISGKHVGITEAVKKYAEKKASKLPKYYSSINQVEVIIEDEPNSMMSVEVIAKGEHSKIFVCTETGSDIYRCIDAAVQKIEEQLRRKKSKERDNKHTGGTSST